MAVQKSLTCKLTTPELQKRKATVISELQRLLQYKEEIENGFSYCFDSTDAILDKINDFIKTERICCDFFTFQLKIEGSKTFLTITGPAGAKEFLKDEINF